MNENNFFNEENDRSAQIRWPQIIRNLVIDTYKSHGAEIWQGFQKDGIQNAIDAINKNSANMPKVWIRYLSNDNLSILVIEDRGTFGLTGIIPKGDQNYDKLNDDDRWARFENVGFAKEPKNSGTSLGARGQGKLMLMSTSSKLIIDGNNTYVNDEDKPTMYYDTLMGDGNYRIGRRQIETFDMTLGVEEGEKAILALRKVTDDLLKPLEYVGTRIIILNPREDVVKSLENGKMQNTISIDWHPILFDKDIQKRVLGKSNPEYVNIDINGNTSSIKPNTKLSSIILRNDNEQVYWIRRNRTMNYNKKPYKVDFFAAAVPENEAILENELAGIGIYRGGMKITSVSSSRIPEHIMKRIYGYVTVGPYLENELRNVEDPTHYTFANIDRGTGAAGKLKNWINDELLLFAREKLGYREEVIEERNKKKKQSISDALNVINNLARKFKLSSTGTSKPNIPSAPPKSPKPLRLEIKKIKFPGGSGNRRVNYGQTMEDIGCDIVNDTEEPIFGILHITAQIGKNNLVDIYESELEVEANSILGSDFCDLLINSDDFPDDGRYFIKYNFILKASVESLGLKEGEMLSRKQEFWVETDPLVSGIFKDIVATTYSDEVRKPFTGQAVPDKGGWIFEYNMIHPRFEQINQDFLARYIAEIVMPWLTYIDVHDNSLEDRQIFKHEIDNEEDYIYEMIRTQGMLEATFFEE